MIDLELLRELLEKERERLRDHEKWEREQREKVAKLEELVQAIEEYIMS